MLTESQTKTFPFIQIAGEKIPERSNKTETGPDSHRSVTAKTLKKKTSALRFVQTQLDRGPRRNGLHASTRDSC